MAGGSRIGCVRVVIDTNVVVCALRSRRGASFRLLGKLGTAQLLPVVSTPLCLEYEDVLRRPGMLPGILGEEIEDFLDYFLSVSVECQVHYLWRPHLPDPKDDLVLELALAGEAKCIVTYNQRDFQGAGTFGIQIVTPGEFLAKLDVQ